MPLMQIAGSIRLAPWSGWDVEYLETEAIPFFRPMDACREAYDV